MYKGIATSAHHIRPLFPAKGLYWIIIRHMLVLTDNQLRTVMDTAGQLPRLKFIALWGALTLTFAFPAQVSPEETITIATLLKGGWQIAGYTSTLDNRSAFILCALTCSNFPSIVLT